MGSRQAAASQKETQMNEIESSPSDIGEIIRLKSKIEALLNDPPQDRFTLEDRYEGIRTLVRQIEDREPHLEPTVLRVFDNDFQRVRVIYSHLHPGFLEEAGTSVLANEYRFFVGELEGYVAKLEDESSDRIPVHI